MKKIENYFICYRNSSKLTIYKFLFNIINFSEIKIQFQFSSKFNFYLIKIFHILIDE
jgi:hypothetical protein